MDCQCLARFPQNAKEEPGVGNESLQSVQPKLCKGLNTDRLIYHFSSLTRFQAGYVPFIDVDPMKSPVKYCGFAEQAWPVRGQLFSGLVWPV
jgi:hypothetical protein